MNIYVIYKAKAQNEGSYKELCAIYLKIELNV